MAGVGIKIVGTGDMRTSSRASFIAWGAAVSASVGGAGVGWLETGSRVFRGSIFALWTVRFGGMVVVPKFLSLVGGGVGVIKSLIGPITVGSVLFF